MYYFHTVVIQTADAWHIFHLRYRYSDFVALFKRIHRDHPQLHIPPLPSTRPAWAFWTATNRSEAAVQRRLFGLALWLLVVLRQHPALLAAGQPLHAFLCQDLAAHRSIPVNADGAPPLEVVQLELPATDAEDVMNRAWVHLNAEV